MDGQISSLESQTKVTSQDIVSVHKLLPQKAHISDVALCVSRKHYEAAVLALGDAIEHKANQDMVAAMEHRVQVGQLVSGK
jgi:hypothetical protein